MGKQIMARNAPLLAFRPAATTTVISTDPAQAVAEQIVRRSFALQHDRLADSNNEIDLLRLIAICVGKHRQYLDDKANAYRKVVPAFLELADRFQRGL